MDKKIGSAGAQNQTGDYMDSTGSAGANKWCSRHQGNNWHIQGITWVFRMFEATGQMDQNLVRIDGVMKLWWCYRWFYLWNEVTLQSKYIRIRRFKIR